MSRRLSHVVIALVSLLGLVLVALAVIALTMDPNRFKPDIVRLVQEKKQRTLSIEGDIRLRLFPRLGVELGPTRLSERGGAGEFAAVEGARLYVAWWPLLRREWVVDRVTVTGARAHLVRYGDGQTNFDDLLSKEESGPVKFDIESVAVSRSAVRFEDRMAGRTIDLQDIRLETGRLREATPTRVQGTFRLVSDKPRVAVAVELASGLEFALGQRRYRLDGLDLKVKGEAGSITGLDLALAGNAEVVLGTAASSLVLKDATLAFKGRQGPQALDVAVSVPLFRLDPERMEAGETTVKAKVEQPGAVASLTATLAGLAGEARQFRSSRLELELDGRQGEASFRGRLASPLEGRLEARTFDLPGIDGQLEWTSPALAQKTLKLALAGRAHGDLARQQASLAVQGRLDDSPVDARLELASFQPPRLGFDVAIDRLDLDRYRPPRPKGASPGGPIDLSALKGIDADGSVRVGELKVANVRASEVRLRLRAKDGRITLDPLSANLYQGTIEGSVSATATASPRILVRQNLSNVSIGPLLRDLADKDLLEGRGHVVVDVATQGPTADAMRKALTGTAALRLSDGAIKGVNIAALLRQARTALAGGGASQAVSPSQQTDFTELAASFRIRDGVAHNEDLTAKSPLLRLAGKGDIDVGAGALDYVLKAVLVGTLEGQGGRDLAQLRGVTVPVRIQGPMEALRFSLDASSLITEFTRARLEEKKEELGEKARQELLKGLFGR